MTEYLVYDAKGVFIGGVSVMEQAVEAAKRKAREDGEPADVVQVSDRRGSRRCRYWPDGSVERLWQKGADDGEEKNGV